MFVALDYFLKEFILLANCFLLHLMSKDAAMILLSEGGGFRISWLTRQTWFSINPKSLHWYHEVEFLHCSIHAAVQTQHLIL